MSQLTNLLRAATGRLWPRSRPTISRPIFAKWDWQAGKPARSVHPPFPRTVDKLTIEDFRQAPVYSDRVDQLFHALKNAPSVGHVLEFGVHKGATLNWLAEWCRPRAESRVFGFDSFEGLPHEWVRTKAGPKYPAGHFALEGLPCVQDNACLIPGFFDASLEPWLAEHSGPIAFLHNDSDLYSSTLLTLRLLNQRIVPGTVIVFDELCEWGQAGVYENWEQGEWKALREWMAEFDREISIISRDQGFAAAIAVTR